MGRLIIKAFAKINLALDVLGRRDDGFHEVEMIMHGINLFDQIEIAPSNEDGIHLVCSSPETGPVKDNLAYRAAQLIQQEFGLKTGLTLVIKKNIPVAAGLAGGSADGAAVLLGLNELFDLKLTKEKLLDLAARLGSDVPFCLNPLAAVARGRGELLTDVPCGEVLWLVLLKPPFGVSTEHVYQNLSNVLIEARPDIPGILKSLAEHKLPKAYQKMANVLEYSTFGLYPELLSQARELKGLGVQRVMMTGSGPTLMAFTEGEMQARQLAASWSKKDWDVIVTRTLQREDLEERMTIYE